MGRCIQFITLYRNFSGASAYEDAPALPGAVFGVRGTPGVASGGRGAFPAVACARGRGTARRGVFSLSEALLSELEARAARLLTQGWG